jgi:hypothetical protein
MSMSNAIAGDALDTPKVLSSEEFLTGFTFDSTEGGHGVQTSASRQT